jgi:phosphatidylethanolamine-binding protein (PEBP) family uncharacterized protein
MKTLLVSAVVVGIAVGAAAQVIAQATPAKITITSSAFKDGEMIPKDYTGDTGAKNVSPPARLDRCAGVNEGIRADSGRPRRRAVQQRAAVRSLDRLQHPGNSEGTAGRIAAGKNRGRSVERRRSGHEQHGARATGWRTGSGPVYRGPAPPAGSGPHHYTFTVYALGRARFPASETLMNKTQLLDVIKGHIVGEGKLIGIFQR